MNQNDKNKKLGVIALILFLLIANGGVYYIFSNKNNDQTSSAGPDVSGYILENGAEPGLTEDEIRELLQKQ